MKKIEMTPEEREALTEFVYMQTGALDVDHAKVARGKELLSPKDCDSCHDFDGTSENTGPNLKGRGTLAWTKAVIAEPGHPLLFGDAEQDAEVQRQADGAGDRGFFARFVLLQKNL